MTVLSKARHALAVIRIVNYPELRPSMRGLTNAFQPWRAVTNR